MLIEQLVVFGLFAREFVSISFKGIAEVSFPIWIS